MTLIFGQLVTAMRIMLFSPFFLGLSNFFSGVTQMNRRFLIYSLSPSLYNIGIIIGALFFYRYLGLAGLVWGVALGACLHMAIQIPFIIRTHTSPRFFRKVHWASVKRVVLLSLPRTLTLSANQLASFFLIALASFMAGGSIAIFNFANSIESVPLTLIGVSYSSAAFPTLSRLFSTGKLQEFLHEVAISARHIIFWSLPVTALFIVLRAQIVRVVLGAGAFDWNATRLTAAALALFIISIVAQGPHPALRPRLLFARPDAGSPSSSTSFRPSSSPDSAISSTRCISRYSVFRYLHPGPLEGGRSAGRQRAHAAACLFHRLHRQCAPPLVHIRAGFSGLHPPPRRRFFPEPVVGGSRRLCDVSRPALL